MSHLIDTDVIIDNLRGDTAATEWLHRHRGNQLAVSILTVGELYKGAYRHPDRDAQLGALASYLGRFAILGLTDAIMHRYGLEYAALRARGQLIDDIDLPIAASALTHDLRLVTRNLRHFDRVPRLVIDDLNPTR